MRNPKDKNQRTDDDGVCDWIFYHSNSKSNLNFPGLTKRQGDDWKLWISGYKLDPWIGGREDQNSLELCFDAILSIKITLYSLCLLKAIIMMLEEEEEIQVQKMCFNSLKDGAWWVLVLKVPNEEAKVLKLLHTLTRKIYFCLPIYMYDLSQVTTPGLLLTFLCRQSVMHCGFRCAIICTMVYSQVCLKQNKWFFFYIVPCLNKYVI